MNAISEPIKSSESSEPSELAEVRYQIITAEAAYRVLRPSIDLEVEELWAIALGPSKNLLQSKMIFRGTVDACLVHPRDIFRFACLTNASALIIAHNHPSGDARPSDQDLAFTRQLVKSAKLLEIPVIDHLIITGRGFKSLAREGWMSAR